MWCHCARKYLSMGWRMPFFPFLPNLILLPLHSWCLCFSPICASGISVVCMLTSYIQQNTSAHFSSPIYKPVKLKSLIAYQFCFLTMSPNVLSDFFCHKKSFYFGIKILDRLLKAWWKETSTCSRRSNLMFECVASYLPVFSDDRDVDRSYGDIMVYFLKKSSFSASLSWHICA